MVRVRLTAIICVVAGVASACTTAGGDADDGAAGTTRTVTVRALDELRFDPETITVRKGETIRFELVNAGKSEHEFVLGDEEAHENHTPGEHAHGGALAGVNLAPGATGEATVTFDEPGKLAYACHVNDHDKAGMVGTLTVTD